MTTLFYGEREADSQDHAVTYTAKPVGRTPYIMTLKFDCWSKATINAADGVITGKTDAGYATADGATTVSGAGLHIHGNRCG